MRAKLATSDEIDGYSAGWRSRGRVRLHEQQQRAAVWRERLSQVVTLLVEHYGVTRVVLFGSLARCEPRPQSDVDLLVYGLAPEALFHAAAAANRVLRDAYVDLMPVELARPEVLARALREGEALYG
ncbi:MAG: nucleotidyltransferase domain-containing protein [Proteobacteria bacterium]|nr:nucleotidyltransferase domain-containing protein [Pseudomonadota bacterium]